MARLILSPAQILVLRCSAAATRPGPGGRNYGTPVRLLGASDWATARALVRKGLGAMDSGLDSVTRFTATPEGLLALAAVTLDQEASR